MEPRVNIRATDLEIASTCLQYLCFRCFEGHLTDEEISSYAWQGYYSFQDFATAYWLEYLRASFDAETRNDLEAVKRLSLLVDNFKNFHSRGQEGVREITNMASTACESEQVDRTISQITDLQMAWKALTKSENTSAKQDLSYFREQLDRRRSIFEKIVVELQSNDPKRVELSTFYGDPGGWFKCSRIQCFAFHEGFPSPATKEAHEKKHQRAFRCPLEACHYSVIGFSSAGELKRHRSKNHATPVEEREATTPQFVIPDMGEDSSLARSELNGKSPMASSIWYSDERTMKDDHSKSVLSHDIMTICGMSGEKRSFNPNTNTPGGADIIAWQRRLGVEDDWVALFDPTSSIRVDVELHYTFQHTSIVCCVSFSKDGRYLATGCNNACQIFDVASGKVLCISESPNSPSGTDNYCRGICFSPNGRHLVSCWDAKYAIEIRSINDEGFCAVTQQLLGHESEPYGVDVSNDNALVASCGADMTIKMWDLPMGYCLNTFRTEDTLTCVGISPDSRLVAATGLDKCAHIWDVVTGQLIASLKGHTNSVSRFSFMERGTQIVTAGLDNAIMIWDITKLCRVNDEPYEYPLPAEQSIGPYKTLLGHSVSNFITEQDKSAHACLGLCSGCHGNV
jgi:WD40 repeat protein